MEQSSPPLIVQPPAPPVGRNESGPRWFLVTFYGLAIVWGIRNVHFWKESLLDLVVPLAMAVALAWWVVADARGRRHPIPLLVRPWFFLLAGLLVPGYLIWSRRGWGMVLLVVHALGWYGLTTVVMHAGGTMVFGEEWWRAMGAR